MGAKNPVLVAQRAKFDKLHGEINAIQLRALEGDGRDLTADELQEIETKSTQLRETAKQIEELADLETRSRAVADVAARLLPDDPDGDGDAEGDTDGDGDGKKSGKQMRSRFTARDRDPGHYRSVEQGGKHSFFSDMFRAKEYEDQAAKQRLTEHTRALSTGANGVGVVPPKWLTSEFETLARQGRAVANAVRRIDLGDDPRPMTLPKQTAGTDDVVDEQAQENDPVDGTDAWDSDVDTVAPKPTSGKQIFSRQMLDMSDPAIDQLIYGDLLSVFNFKVEKKVCDAMIAAAATSVTLASEATDWTASGATDAVIDASTDVWENRFLPADILVCSIKRFGKFRKLKDGSNRPLMPFSSYGPQNAAGLMQGQQTGEIEGLTVIPTAGMGADTAYPQKFLVARSMDTILFESNMLRFRYEEQAGPESIVLGVWAYTAVAVRQKGASATTSKSVRAVQVTAA